MKVVKGAVLLFALLVMGFSISPLNSSPVKNQDPGSGGGSGGSSWTVTCTYDAHEILISKSCTSGGGAACSCP